MTSNDRADTDDVPHYEGQPVMKGDFDGEIRTDGGDTPGLTDAEDVQDSLVEYVEDSELAEIVVTVSAVAYLGASELGYVETVPELRWLSLAVVLSVMGLDTMYKRMRRKNGGT